MVLDFFKLYFVALGLFIFFDFLWLFFVASSFIEKGEEGVNGEEKQNVYLVFYFYFIFILGMVLFVLYPGIEKNSLFETGLRGFSFGLLVYGLYNVLGNKKSKKFTSLGNIFDLFWGGFLSLVVSLICYYFYFNYLL